VLACAGDVPALEILAATDILRQYLPQPRVRVVNVVDLTRLQPAAEHPHGMSDAEFNALFTTDRPVIFRPVIFAYHGYPWLSTGSLTAATATTTSASAATRRRAPQPPRRHGRDERPGPVSTWSRT
jgi:phosphoketolase